MALRTTGVRYDIIARDRASRTFARVGGAADGLARSGTELGTALRRGFALGGAAAVGFAGVSIKAAADFQASMTKISTQAGGSARDVKVLGDQVLKLGGKVQQAPEQLAGALYHLKSVGMDNADAMKALRQASDLAAVGGANLEETTNALAGAWRTGIRGAGSFHEAVSTVNAIIGAGNMRMEDFNAAIGTGILASAKTFGLSLKQVGAALALMTDEGIPATDAATRLRMSFSLLGAPSHAAEKQLKKIGLTGLQLGQAMRGPDGLIGAIQLLKDHLDKSGMSAAQQSQILSRAFGGGRTSSGIMTLINNLDVLKRKQDQVNHSAGRFDDAVRQQRKTAEAEWKRLTGGLESLSVRIGTKVLPPVTGFVGFLNDTAMPAAAHFGRVMAGIVPVGTIKARVGEASTLISDFFAGLSGKHAKANPLQVAKVRLPADIAAPVSDSQRLGERIRDAVTGGIGRIDWGKAGSAIGRGLGKAVSGAMNIAAWLGKAVRKTDWLEVGKKVGATAIPFAIGFVNNLLAPLFTGSFWSKHWTDVLLFAVSVIPIGRIAGALGKVVEHIPVLRVFAPLLKGVAKFGGSLEKGLGKLLKPVRRIAGAIGRGFADGLEHVFPGLKAGLKHKLDNLALMIFGYWARFGAAGRRLIDGLGRGILSMSSKVGGWVGRVTGWLVRPFARAGSWLIGKGRDLVSGLKSGVLSVARTIGSWTVDHVISPVTGRFSRAGSWLAGKGRALVSGLKSGIGSAMRGIGGWIKRTVVDPVVGAVKRFFGIHSPSKVFAEIGGHLVGGLLKGLSVHSGTSIARKVFGDMPSALAALVEKGVTSVSSLPGRALKALGGLGGKLLGLLGLGGGGGGSSATQRLGQTMAAAYGWTGSQWAALRALWTGESKWNPQAHNRSSGAYGIPQALPASKMASAGADWQTNPATQIKWGLGYIAGRYGSPLAAYSAWLSRSPHWYVKGTGGAARGLAWVGERGPELVNFKGGEDVLSNPQSMAFAKANGIKLPGYASGTILNAADRVRRDQQRVEDARDALARAKARHHNVEAAKKRLHAAEKELQAAEIALKNAKRTAKGAIATTLATGFLKKLETGSSSAIASAIKSITTKLLNAGFDKLAKSVTRSGDKLEALVGQRTSIEKKIAAANQYASEQTSNIRDYLSISGTSATSVGALISQMTGQQKTASGLATEVRQLRTRGASKALLAQLAEAGPGSQLATILGGTDVTAQDITKLNKLVASGGKLASSFGKSMADMMYDSGKNAGKGFLTGLKSQEKALQTQIDKLGQDLVKAIKKALKIKSPSQVMRDQVGKQIALGMVVGMDAHRPHVAAAARRLAATAYGASARPAGGPAAVSELTRLLTSGQLGGTEVHVHFNDDRLRDLIDVRVAPKIKASEQRQAHRAKVGRAAMR